MGKNVCILPNNKVTHRPVDSDVLNNAEQIGLKMGGWARLAMELIDYDSRYTATIQHVFTTFIVCSTSRIASAIINSDIHVSRKSKIKCVSLDGDVYDSYSVTGGANESFVSILTLYKEFKQLEAEIEAEQKIYNISKRHY